MTAVVTVLMAVHNGGELLRSSVESVLGQTYRDFELLVIDDGSTDGSADVARSYADERIRVLENERNIGQVPSLNLGLRAARGRYVARLDHDDRSRPTRLERQVELLEDHDRVALVGTWIDVVGSDGRLWTSVRGEMRDFREFVTALLVNRFPWGHPSIMFRREVMLELGGYDPTLPGAEDLDFYRRLGEAGWQARVVREPLVLYLRHEEQMSQSRGHIVSDSDRRGHERFFGRLVPGADARALRLLLTDDEPLWSEVAEPEAGARLASALDRLADEGLSRFALTEEERASVTASLASNVARTVSRGWRKGAPGWAQASEPLAAWAAANGAPPGVSYSAARFAAPALVPAFAAQAHLTRSLARSTALAPLRRRARRLRPLRDAYRRLAGTR
jgi:glycosyltransferase involved in cell wall biosynthesis